MVESIDLMASEGYRGNGFRALIELSPDFVLVLSRTGVVRYVSPAIARVAGFAPHELLGRSFTDFVHPEDGRRAGDDLRRLVDTGEVLQSTVRFRHKDGSWISLETLGRAYSEAFDFSGILLSTREVTRHAEWERVLRDSARETDDLYENAPCGYHSVDASGTITRINRTELEWLQYTREEVVDRLRSVDLLTTDSQRAYASAFSLLKKHGRVRDVEMEAVRKDGSIFYVLVSATAILDSDGRFLSSRTTLFDITERKRAESALRRLNRTLLVLRSCNQELVRAEERAQLLNAVCRVVVEIGGYRMAWVGLAEQDERKTVRPVAVSGFDNGYVDSAEITWSDSEFGSGPTGTAIRTGAIQVAQDIVVAPNMSRWRTDAVERGFRASIALPLKGHSRVIGALSIYASESEAFDAAETKLLRELADDLAFGIETLETRSENQRAEAEVKHLAFFDPLTGLANRAQFLERAQKARVEAHSADDSLALLALHLSHYSDLQSGLGVRTADEVLEGLARRLEDVMPESTLLARVADATFAVLLPAGDAETAQQLAQRILGVMREPFEVGGLSVDIQMYIGGSVFPGDGTEVDVLLLRSQLAASEAFAAGEGYARSKGRSDSENPRRLVLVGELRRAIEADQLLLRYQPKIDMRGGRVAGVEALVSWQHPDRGTLPPNEFIPLAEQTGLVKPLTYWVINAALSQAYAWVRAGLDIPIAVNVPAASLRDPDFPGRVSDLLEASGVGPDSLQMEITETAMMEDPKHAHMLLEQLRARGVRIFVDDFGTGYSSLGYIASLPLDGLKIDRSFIAQMLSKPRTRSVVAATISLARSLQLDVVAEGVESLEQVRDLTRMHCEAIQGFYFSRPVAADQLESWASTFTLAGFGLSAINGGDG